MANGLYACPALNLASNGPSNLTANAAGANPLWMQVIDEVDQIDANAIGEWRQLTENPMSGPDWLLTWWRHYRQNGERLQLVTFYINDQLAAVAPLYLTADGCLKLLGSGKVCSDHCELLLGQPGWVTVAEPLLLDWLLSDAAPNWKSMFLEAIDRESQTSEFTQQWQRQNQLLGWTTPGAPTCSIPLPDQWDDYLKSLSKNHRKRVRRWTRQHLDSQEVQQRSTDDGWNTQSAFDQLIQLHNLRRGDLADKGAFEDSTFCDFHREVFELLAAQGQACITAIYVDDDPKAVEYELCNRSTVFAYQSGAHMDGVLASPGSVSILTRLQKAIEGGKTNFDLMRGDEGYKQHWNAQCVLTTNIRLWPPTFAGRMARTKFHAKRRLRSAAKKFLKRAHS